MIKVLLVDDHDLVRTGVRMILEGQTDIKVVGECADGESALKAFKKLRPDVILMDVNMPGAGGLEATSRLRQLDKKVRVIILTIHAKAPFPKRLLDAGANGYLTKGCAKEELVNAIVSVYRGQRYIGGDIAQQLALSLLPGATHSPFDDLSAREMEVMMLLVQGDDLKHIAKQMHLSPKTISTYKYRLYEKLEVESDVGLVRLAMTHGIIEDSINA